jgi:site-specific recombinase XerD
VDLIEQFAARHFVLNNISEIRQRRHVRVLRDYEAWLAPTPLLQATPDQVRSWMTEQVGKGYHVNTIRFWLMMLRPFWRWAWEAGHLDADTWLRLKDVPPPRGASGHSEPNPYTRAEIKNLWRSIADKYPLADAKRLDRWARRYQIKQPPPYKRVAPHGRRMQLEAIVSLALFCGLRRGEIWQLSLDDLHPDNAYLVVRTKRSDHRDKVRKVPYTEPAREAVTRWLSFRKTLFIKHHRSPWLSLHPHRPREPMHPTHFNGLLRKFGFEYHRLRHTCATERLRAGMPIELLQRFLGHASLTQTLAYAKIVERDIDKQVEQHDDEFMKAVGPRRAA